MNPTCFRLRNTTSFSPDTAATSQPSISKTFLTAFIFNTSKFFTFMSKKPAHLDFGRSPKPPLKFRTAGARTEEKIRLNFIYADFFRRERREWVGFFRIVKKFRVERGLFCASSPWAKQGKFYKFDQQFPQRRKTFALVVKQGLLLSLASNAALRAYHLSQIDFLPVRVFHQIENIRKLLL